MENFVKQKKSKDKESDVKGSDESTRADLEIRGLKDKQIEEYTLLLKRIQADFENYKKRSEKEVDEKTRYAVAQFISKLLPTLDSFELALKNTNKSANKMDINNPEKFRQGMELIHNQLLATLKKENIEEIKSVGQKFDPFRHEAIMKANDLTTDDEIILEEFQKGYVYRDIVIRPSKVKINKIENEKAQEAAQLNKS